MMLARMGSISMGGTSYMNTPQRGTASQTNTWASSMHSVSQTNTWAPFMHSASQTNTWTPFMHLATV